MTCLRATTLGMFWLFVFGCQTDRPLGDIESDAGAGDGAGATGIGGTTGGFANGGSATGGSASGGSANGGSEEGGTSSGGSTNGGAANAGSTNGGSANGGGPGDDCFSPDNRPELALDPNATGCECAGEEVDQCIAVSEGARLHLLAMVCHDGRWSSVEDGPCEPGTTVPWGCMIENRVLKAGGPVPPEFLCRLCQWCGADWNGACPVIFCQAPECPAGTVLDSRCRSCGMGPGGCDIEEHGCFEPCANAEDCEFGSCVNGTCEVGPCI